MWSFLAANCGSKMQRVFTLRDGCWLPFQPPLNWTGSVLYPLLVVSYHYHWETKGGFVKGWFWQMYPRSGFRSGGTSAETTLLETTLLSTPKRGHWEIKGRFPKGWFWRTCPRSGFRSGGTSAKTTLLETTLLRTPDINQEWPRQTKPKKGQFMNFSQGHSGTKVQCESCLFSWGKHQNSQKWAKFMNFLFLPFLWFGLPGRLLNWFFQVTATIENQDFHFPLQNLRTPEGFQKGFRKGLWRGLWRVSEGFRRVLEGVSRRPFENPSKTLQRPFLKPFWNPSGVRVFCSRKWKSWS